MEAIIHPHWSELSPMQTEKQNSIHMLMSIKYNLLCGQPELDPHIICKSNIQIQWCVLLRPTTQICRFLISSAETVIVYLDKLEQARFNEWNMGVTFVSRGDTIRKKRTNKQIFLTATCLSLIIRFLILLVIEGAQNLITCSRWGERRYTSSLTSSLKQGGLGWW